MKIWNAFASNNSGSYTIVGAFESAELASEVADELHAMAVAHSKYLDPQTSSPPGPSPLEVLAAKYNVAATLDEDEWPQHSAAEHPSAFAIGRQVFVHSDYTITMPASIGAIMYARGGRVSTELNHAHHPIAATFTVWFPWQTKKTLDVPALLQRFVDDICREDGALSLPQAASIPPAWRTTSEFGEGDLHLGAAFTDLAPAYAAVQAAATAIGAQVGVAIREAHGDPFAHLRPCDPPSNAPMVDVVVEARGDAPSNLASTIALRRRVSHEDAHLLLQQLPAVVLENVPLAIGTRLRDELSVGNAVVSLRAASSSRHVDEGG